MQWWGDTNLALLCSNFSLRLMESSELSPGISVDAVPAPAPALSLQLRSTDLSTSGGANLDL